MICQLCRKQTASLIVRQIVNGTTKELQLCRACAQKHHIDPNAQDISASLKAIFDELLPQLAVKDATGSITHPLVCPDCGMTLSRVKEEKILGCSRCFFYFRDTVLKLMQEASGEVFYAGNLPVQPETFSGEAVSLRHLEEELQKAVENEEYELAAYLRDKIKEQEVST